MAPLEVAVCLFEAAVGVQTMPELGSHIAQLPGIRPSGCFEQDGLGVAKGLPAGLLGGAGD